MSAFLASLLAVLGPLIAKALGDLLTALIDKWKNKPAAAQLLAGVKNAADLYATMPQLLKTVEGDFTGFFERRRFARLAEKLAKKPATDAVWDHMLSVGAVAGEPTNVPFIDVIDAVQ